MQKLKDLINQAEELSSNIHKLTSLNAEFVQRQIDKHQQKLDPIKKKIDLITELLLEEKNDS